jgi:DNA-directed RNA polymerase subunit RPC12/RpoP
MNTSTQVVNREAIALHLWKRDRFAMKQYESLPDSAAIRLNGVWKACPSCGKSLFIPIQSQSDVATGTTLCPLCRVRILLVADEIAGHPGLFWKSPRIYAKR